MLVPYEIGLKDNNGYNAYSHAVSAEGRQLLRHENCYMDERFPKFVAFLKQEMRLMEGKSRFDGL